MNLNDASSVELATTPRNSQSESFKESAADGHPLGGFTWRHARTDLERAVVIINAATSVR